MPPNLSLASRTYALTKGKKRTLTVRANVEFDLDDASIPVTKEVIDAMRRRILELEDALDDRPPAKRSKVSKIEDNMPEAGPSTDLPAGANAKANAKKVDVLLKKFWTSLQKEVKTEKYKFRGGGDRKVCKIDEVIEVDEFHAIFDGKGTLTQPTPMNKPTSTVTIRELGSGDVEDLFGKHYKELKGNRFSVGGIAARFAKGEKMGTTALDITGLSVSYARNTMKCSMKFEVEEHSDYDHYNGFGFGFSF
ncbi:hypothetical protein M0805_009935 [Coniferiporia weirii]|nr:hypothetical protein M0805_009935 [Coniferiporia weirii]